MAILLNTFVLTLMILLAGCSGLKKDPWKYEESVDKLTNTKKLRASADFDGFKDADGLQVNALFECSGSTPAGFLLTISSYDQKTKGDRLDAAPIKEYKLRWGNYFMTVPAESLENFNNEALLNGQSINTLVYLARNSAGEETDIQSLDFTESNVLNDLSANPQAIIQLTTNLGKAELDIDLKTSSVRKVVEACGYSLEAKKTTTQVPQINKPEPTTVNTETVEQAAPAATESAVQAPEAETSNAESSSNTVILETASYIINITQNCPEGDIACNDVTYLGKSKKSGSSITLKGRVLPNVGYEFTNGNVKYVIQDEGEAATLIVTQGNKTLVQENGEWSTQ